MRKVRIRNIVHDRVKAIVKDNPVYDSVERFIDSALTNRILEVERAFPVKPTRPERGGKP